MIRIYAFLATGLLLFSVGCGQIDGTTKEPIVKLPAEVTLPDEKVGVRGKITKLTIVDEEEKEKEPGSPLEDPDESVSSTDPDSSSREYRKDIEGFMMVEGKDEEVETDKASLTITDKTRIFRQEENRQIPVTLNELKKADKVEVYFIGPVMESYPVQATAGIIVILE